MGRKRHDGDAGRLSVAASSSRTLVWFRGKDLRLTDHAPLHDALRGGEVIPLFVLDPYFFAPERARKIAHRIQFLLDGLVELDAAIRERGSRLVVVPGRSVDVVPALAARLRVDRVVAHRWVEPFGRERDRRIAASLRMPFDLFEGETLAPPGSLRNASGQPFNVFTHFARAFRRTVDVPPPIPAPAELPPLPKGVDLKSAAIPTCEALGIARNRRVQQGGEAAAAARLRAFLAGPARSYEDGRNQLAAAGTSRLSADLKFGTISARTVWNAVTRALGSTPSGEAFTNELLWREFTHSTLWDRPEVLTSPFRPAFGHFPWRVDDETWVAWVEGRTGYPVVDAAARQLLEEGFVHNRARMIAASFLTKHLLVDYRLGEAHYLAHLTDGDWAQNNAGWQWSAGCGCDAQPYFRVFNPVTQGEKFDEEGAYVRRYVPELASVPAAYVHRPWEAPPLVLAEAGVVLGKDYPRPIVDHQTARDRFLKTVKKHLGR